METSQSSSNRFFRFSSNFHQFCNLKKIGLVALGLTPLLSPNVYYRQANPETNNMHPGGSKKVTLRARGVTNTLENSSKITT